MNGFERLVNARLEGHPSLKRVLRRAYQGVLGSIPTREHYPAARVVQRPGFFAGFHDLCPWSSDGSKLLAHDCTSVPLRIPDSRDRVCVGYFEGPRFDSFVAVDTTGAFNWQEGARAQWVGDSDELVFNRIVKGRPSARRSAADGTIRFEYDLPVSATSPDGRTAATYNFQRTGRYDAAYGYAGLDGGDTSSAPCDEGLRVIDLDTGRSELRVNLLQLLGLSSDVTMNGAFHYVSHCQFSPDSRQISFMHCWLVRGRRFSRLLALDLRSDELREFPFPRWVSHHCWAGENSLIAFANDVRGKAGYFLCDADSGGAGRIVAEHLASDGHPQLSHDRRWMVTDTYPDRHRRQRLIVYSMGSGESRVLASLRVPVRYSEGLRCDFHPRWNRDATMVCFDSAHSGVRALCTLEFEGEIRSGPIGLVDR